MWKVPENLHSAFRKTGTFLLDDQGPIPKEFSRQTLAVPLG